MTRIHDYVCMTCGERCRIERRDGKSVPVQDDGEVHEHRDYRERVAAAIVRGSERRRER